VEGSCEHGNETSGSVKCWVVVLQLAASQERLSSMKLVTYWHHTRKRTHVLKQNKNKLSYVQ
jgi:hypothetical protein